MNVLRFTKDEDCKTPYEVELDFEYTQTLEKRITSLILYRPDIRRSVVIPWSIFEEYVRGMKNSAFIDPTGMKVKYNDGQLHVSGYKFNLIVPSSHIKAITSTASQILESVSYSVENILMEYSMQGM